MKSLWIKFQASGFYRAIAHNPGTFVALLLALFIGGCNLWENASVESRRQPGVMVNRNELDAEVATYAIDLQARHEALNVKIALIKAEQEALKVEAQKEAEGYKATYANLEADEDAIESSRKFILGLAGQAGDELGLPLAGILGALLTGKMYDTAYKNRKLVAQEESLNRLRIAAGQSPMTPRQA